MKSKKIIKIAAAVIAAVLLVTAGYVIYTNFNCNIPKSQQIKEMVYYDYYYNLHWLLGDSAKLYEITIDDFVSSDKVFRNTVSKVSLYSFSCVIDGKTVKSCIEYPGMPDIQYYGFPRLSHNEKYILITDCEISPERNISLRDGYYLFFIQEIDGVEYAYPCIYDTSMIPLSVISENIEFTYVSESQIYDSYYDADVCDFLEKNSQANPEWSYKLSADDLRNKYRLLLHR